MLVKCIKATPYYRENLEAHQAPVVTHEHLKSLTSKDWKKYSWCEECNIWYLINSDHECSDYTRYLGSILDPRD